MTPKFWTVFKLIITNVLFSILFFFKSFLSYWQTIKKRHQGNKWKIVFEELIFKNLENEDEEDVEEFERIKSADPLISLRRGHFGNLRKSTMPAKSLRAVSWDWTMIFPKKKIKKINKYRVKSGYICTNSYSLYLLPCPAKKKSKCLISFHLVTSSNPVIQSVSCRHHVMVRGSIL